MTTDDLEVKLGRVLNLCIKIDEEIQAISSASYELPEEAELTSFLTPVEEVAEPCAICLEPVPTAPRALPCRHVFCRGCITRWLERNQDCPLCKKPAFYVHRISSSQCLRLRLLVFTIILTDLVNLVT